MLRAPLYFFVKIYYYKRKRGENVDNGIEVKILEVKNKKNDVILISYDPKYFDVVSAAHNYEAIIKQFPDYNFIGTVQGVKFEVEDIDNLINHLKEIKEGKK